MMDWGEKVARLEKRTAEIEAMRVATAFAALLSLERVERKASRVTVRSRGLFSRMVNDVSLRIARRWGK